MAQNRLSVKLLTSVSSLEFPLDNASGRATILNGQAATFEVVDSAGAPVGELGGIALTASGS